MNAAAIARIAAWNVISDQGMPAGSKVVVEDGWVTIRPRGGREARVPYGPSETLESLYGAIKDAAQSAMQDPR